MGHGQYVYGQYPSFLARDCNACFSQIFEERTFGKLTPDEMNIISIKEPPSHFVRHAKRM